MAAASTLQYGRQKKSVYGKASKSSWTTNFFDESDDELASRSPAPNTNSVTQRDTSVKASYPVQKSAPSPKLRKTKAAKQDAFDVPSSDDEPSPPLKAIQKPAFRSKRLLVDDQTKGETSLAPWERERSHTITTESNGTAKLSKIPAATPEDQLRSDLVSAAKPAVQKQRSLLNGAPTAQQSSSTSSNDVGKLLSAAARLAARKRVAEPSAFPTAGTKTRIVKRAPVKAASEGTPRKRAKMTDVSRESSVDVVMTDDTTLPVCDVDGREPTSGDANGIYDFPDSSADESSKLRQQSKSSRISKKPARRSKPTLSSPRATPRKGLSAPARLAEMLPADSDMTETSTASPPAARRSATPQQSSTPPSLTRRSPDTAIKSRGNITPKQAQLWNRLLPNQPVAPSPSALAMKELTISGQKARSSERLPAAKRMTKSQSEIDRRRTRLVDRLKASAQSSSEDESDSSSSELEDVSDLEADDGATASPPLLKRAESTQSRVETASATQSQTRSQPTANSTAGLKRTYASQRSYLAEDNLEDDIMAGLLEDTPKQPATKPKVFGRSQARSNKDAFDLEDSDEDLAGTGAIRSIHELRAAGRNIRGTEDIEQMLEDIENTTAQHKSRRRSALIELATKLADKNFASRFIGQGCDVRLARQCSASQDHINNCLLAAALVLLLASDPPEHTLRTLQDSLVAPWLGSLLSATKDIGKMAKDRQYNMAKASQTSLVQLGELLRTQQSLWGEDTFAAMSTRIIALKGLDLLTGRLRQVGDNSEILDPEHLQVVFPGDQLPIDSDLDTSLAISTLESLSTASLALAWDADLLHRIAQTLISVDKSSPRRRHTFFLTLRLTLNLTTDNARNCDVLATNPQTVYYLLQTVLEGFSALDAETEEENRKLALDLLVLALASLMNLFEHSATARSHATHTPGTSDQITSLVHTFTSGQERMLEAESVAESISNVALGYLAVVLANLCQDVEAKTVVREALPGKRLGVLGDAVEEFVLFHQQVDGMAGLAFEGEEGKAVWGGFTEKLRRVLERIRGLEGESQGKDWEA